MFVEPLSLCVRTMTTVKYRVSLVKSSGSNNIAFDWEPKETETIR
jgi:hypothetical protein